MITLLKDMLIQFGYPEKFTFVFINNSIDISNSVDFSGNKILQPSLNSQGGKKS